MCTFVTDFENLLTHTILIKDELLIIGDLNFHMNKPNKSYVKGTFKYKLYCDRMKYYTCQMIVVLDMVDLTLWLAGSIKMLMPQSWLDVQICECMALSHVHVNTKS